MTIEDFKTAVLEQDNRVAWVVTDKDEVEKGWCGYYDRRNQLVVFLSQYATCTPVVYDIRQVFLRENQAMAEKCRRSLMEQKNES